MELNLKTLGGSVHLTYPRKYVTVYTSDNQPAAHGPPMVLCGSNKII